MAEAPRNQLPSGYDEEFLNAVEDDFQCLICHLPLKEPVLTRCGHRFCKECLVEHFRRKRVQNEPSTCPTDREGLDQDRDVFPDKATERKVLSFAIKCPSRGCNWTGELRNKEVHLASCIFKFVSCTNKNCHVKVQRGNLKIHVAITCPWRNLQCDHCNEPHPECQMQVHTAQCKKFPVSCPNNCGGSFPREMIPNHIKDDCPLTIIPCSYVKIGCKAEVQRKQVESHLQSAVRLHLDLACVKLNDTELELNNTKAKLNNTEVKLNDTEEKTRELMKKFDTLQRQLHDTQDNLEKTKKQVSKFDTNQAQFSLELNNTKVKLNDTQGKLETATKQVSKFDTNQAQFSVELNNTKVKLNDTQEKLETARKQVSKFDTNQAQFSLELNNTKVKLNETQEKLETARKQTEKFDNLFVWKIDNFGDLLRQAKAGEKTYIYSLPFYSRSAESCGYKFKVCIEPNGAGSGRNTHLSVFIIVMKGEYDAILPWPIEKRVAFTLIDQQEDPVQRENVVMSFIPDNYQEAFARPTQEENNGHGFHEFISHEKLRSRRYLKDDTLFLQTEIGP